MIANALNFPVFLFLLRTVPPVFSNKLNGVEKKKESTYRSWRETCGGEQRLSSNEQKKTQVKFNDSCCLP